MSDEEIALKFVEFLDIRNQKEVCWDTYIDFLERIKEYKSKTLKGELEHELKEFDKTTAQGIAVIDYDRFVKKIRDLLKEN